ncbi:MAG: sugar ABC transporter permease [Clostridia bacterium]
MSKKRRNHEAANVLFMLPSITGVALFVVWPFAGTLLRSVQDAMGEMYVGFENYRRVFENEAMRLAAGNTLRFIAVCIPLLLTISLGLALLIRPVKRGAGLFSATFLLPMAIPVASVALIWQVLFAKQGFLSALVAMFGGQPTDWVNSDSAFWVLVLSYLWRNVGYDMVLWRASIAGLDPTQSEAAQVDGANAWQRFRYVTLPALLPTLFTITVLSLLNSFKVYREAYLIAGAYPHSSIYLLQHLFNNWFMSLDMQKLCAAAALVALVILLLISVLQRLWERSEP